MKYIHFLFPIFMNIINRYVVGQDLQGVCITCKDNFLNCKLNCVVPHNNVDKDKAWPINTPVTLESIQSCINKCVTIRNNCVDSEETKKCYSCSLECAKNYDASILTCVNQHSTTKKATYNKNQDACANKVGYIATTCMETCYGSDMLNGWTPETEIGILLEQRTMSKFIIPEPK